MAYNVALWVGNSLKSFDEADGLLNDESFREAQIGKAPSPVLQQLVHELLFQYPEPPLDDNDFDDDAWVWTSSPMMNDIEGDVLILGIKWGTDYAPVPALVKEKAAAHGVNFLDWQTGEYVRPSIL